MPRLLDETFLTLHPRTALWWQQREQCRRCDGLRITAGGGMSCRTARKHGGRSANTSCLDARDNVCGPDARLFEPKRATS